MRTISRNRFVKERLDFVDIVDSDDANIRKVRYVMIDNKDGEIYDGVLNDDGSFDDGYTTWESVEVFERSAALAGIRNQLQTSTCPGGTQRPFTSTM